MDGGSPQVLALVAFGATSMVMVLVLIGLLWS